MRQSLSARITPGTAAVVRSSTWTMGAALAVCLPGLLSGVPAVAAVAAVAAILSVAAVGTGWRTLGSAATAALTTSLIGWVLLGPAQVVILVQLVGVALLISVVVGLDTLELRLRRQRYDVISLPPRRDRLVGPAVATAAAGLVALAGGQPVVASGWLVGMGLLAAVAALVTALRRL